MVHPEIPGCELLRPLERGLLPAHYFDVMAFSHGELTNWANIARDGGVDAKLVKEYYRILADTLLGTMLEPFAKRRGYPVILAAGKFFGRVYLAQPGKDFRIG